nr:hypothetical protein CFP56_65754 [Quercus suber]
MSGGAGGGVGVPQGSSNKFLCFVTKQIVSHFPLSVYRLSLSSTAEVSVFLIQIKVRPFRGCCQRNFPTLPSLSGQIYDIFV